MCFFFSDREGTSTPLISSDVYSFGAMIENVCIIKVSKMLGYSASQKEQ